MRRPRPCRDRPELGRWQVREVSVSELLQSPVWSPIEVIPQGVYLKRLKMTIPMPMSTKKKMAEKINGPDMALPKE